MSGRTLITAVTLALALALLSLVARIIWRRRQTVPDRQALPLDGLAETPATAPLPAVALDLRTADAVGSDDVAVAAPRWTLVVEDDTTNRRLVIKMLERLGWHVDVSADGREALDRMRQQSYDVVLFDCLAHVDGVEFVRAVRRMEKPASATAIVGVGVEQGRRQACLDAGMDDFIATPVALADLRRCLERVAPIDAAHLTSALAEAIKTA